MTINVVVSDKRELGTSLFHASVIIRCR